MGLIDRRPTANSTTKLARMIQSRMSLADDALLSISPMTAAGYIVTRGGWYWRPMFRAQSPASRLDFIERHRPERVRVARETSFSIEMMRPNHPMDNGSRSVRPAPKTGTNSSTFN
jgi:hypothetical protein